MWNLKGNTNELIYKRETDSQTQKTNMVTEGKGAGQDKLGVWVNRYTLLYIHYMNSKDLLYSTGHYSQCLVITHKAK